MIKGIPDRWQAGTKSSVVLREWKCAILLAELACLHGGFDNGFLLAQKEDDAFLGLCKL